MNEHENSMFKQAVRTLAAIDDALGIGDDGCADPDITLSEIEDLKAAAKRGDALARAVMADSTSADNGAKQEQENALLKVEVDHLNKELAEYVEAAKRLSIERAELRRSNEHMRKALEFYADPEVYKPHPHGPAFDRSDLSWRARVALDA